ncbi:MAG: NAD kinase [Rhodobiaceae bacterium]|nr:NAD kinase [Rhodobiaceae bacterium]
MKIALTATDQPKAQEAFAELSKRYDIVDAPDADIIIALGGDGLMLQCLKKSMDTHQKIFGMHCGSVGFLMNNYSPDNLEERLSAAVVNKLSPLKMTATDIEGNNQEARAINEVSLLRKSAQAAHLKIMVDDRERLSELACDGIMVATPAGSTAYNLSAHGPILPINAPLLALTPISAFRPRRWRGALLPDIAKVTIQCLDYEKRPVSAMADNFEILNVTKVDIEQDKSTELKILFDADHNLDERILNEQFVN